MLSIVLVIKRLFGSLWEMNHPLTEQIHRLFFFSLQPECEVTSVWLCCSSTVTCNLFLLIRQATCPRFKEAWESQIALVRDWAHHAAQPWSDLFSINYPLTSSMHYWRMRLCLKHYCYTIHNTTMVLVCLSVLSDYHSLSVVLCPFVLKTWILKNGLYMHSPSSLKKAKSFSKTAGRWCVWK